MHVAEQLAEIEECIGEYGRRPVELLNEHGIIGDDFTAVHAIHITEPEAGYLGAAKSHVCACPTTERNLGDGAVPADLLSRMGAAICFGSDSNAQVDLLEDARCLEYHLRMKELSRAVLSADTLYRGATENGARALRITPSDSDYLTIDLNHPSLAGMEGSDFTTQLIFAAGRHAICDVFVAGKQVIANGRHPDESDIISSFMRLQQRLWR
jgi:formimidoylglutamate deiminase